MAKRLSAEEAMKAAEKHWESFVENLLTIQPMTAPSLYSLPMRYNKYWQYDDAMKIIKDNL